MSEFNRKIALGNEFERTEQEAWLRAEGDAVDFERRTDHPVSGKIGYMDVHVTVTDGDHVLIVENKYCEWDRMQAHRVRPNARKYIRQVWRYIEGELFDAERNYNGVESVSTGIAFALKPRTPGRAELIQGMFDDELIALVWRDETIQERRSRATFLSAGKPQYALPFEHYSADDLDAADERDERLLQRLETSPEQDASAWIESPAARAGTVELSDYRDKWRQDYARIARQIHRCFGTHIHKLEHVGSTSVRGLTAKPVIDVCLLVVDAAAESAYVPDLEAVGYRLVAREPHWHEHRLLRGPSDEVPLNLHVFSLGSNEAARMLLFRDWMRAHDADRDLYAQTKLNLATQNWNALQDYTVSKDGVIDDIIQRAVAARRAARQAERARRAAGRT